MDYASAIANRSVIEFTYDGHRRVVIPAAFGTHATTGNPILRGYQIGGTSSSRAVPLWDLFLVHKIGSPTLTGESFSEDPPGYRRGDKHISPIVAQL